MDIIISGTKNGHTIFTPKKLPGVFDAGLGQGVAALGKEAYAINFENKNSIFTKYKIVKDVRGDKRTGFVAFSLFLPYNKKLSGKDIMAVLDTVSDEYCKRYIPDGRSLDDVRENFTFLDHILEEYEPKPSNEVEPFKSGATDAAFIYYTDAAELQRYFDTPFQDEYRKFRQVLFINKELKDNPANPLNALRHSEKDLTGLDIEVFKHEGNDYYSENAKLCPRELSDGKLHIQLSKNVRPKKEKYAISAGEHGEKIKDSYYSEKEDGSDLPTDIIKPNKGYKFTGYKLDKSKKENGYAGTLIAQYEKEESFFNKLSHYVPKQVAVIILGSLIILGVVLIIPPGENLKDKIEAYVQGTELYLNTLTNLQSQWENEPHEIEKKGTFVWYKWETWNRKNGQILDSTKYKEWKADSTKIADAINLRNLINDRNFEELQKQNYDYSEQQEPFKKAVNNIDSLQYDIVINRLRDVSKLTLDQIADSINVILAQIYPQGDKLCSEELNRLKNLHDEKRPDSASSEYYEEWKADSTKIASAINLRKLINEHNFEELRKKQDYSQQQQKFKEAVKKIVLSQDKVVKIKLGNVSNWDLTQIADFINDILDQIKLQEKEITRISRLTATDKTKKEIEKYLKNNPELNSDIINAYYKVKGLDKPLNKSLKLCETFWKIVHGKDTTTFWSLRKSVNEDPNLISNQNLNSFLDSICNQDKVYLGKYNDARGKESCTSLEDLKKIIK